MSALPVERAVVAEPHERRPTAVRAAASNAWTAALGLLALPCLAHFAFSRFGFNPTDDGFVLAYGRRLLEGQVPHRDFISIRPVGSALLHLPELLLGGDHVFLVGRFVTWLEIGLIAWCGVLLARRLTGQPHGRLGSALAVVAAFVFTAGSFPIMPWHTIDGLALAAGGFALVTSRGAALSLAGCALLGTAALCRQNLLPLGLLAIALLPAARRLVGAAAWLAAPVLYAASLAVLGALPDAIEQMQSQTGLLEPGVLRYATSPHVLLGVVLGACVGLAARRADRSRLLGAAAELAVPALLAWAAWSMAQSANRFLWAASFAMFGASLGVTLTGLAPRRAVTGEVRLGVIALVTAWCTSISVGMNTPALAAGTLAIHLLAVATPAPERRGRAGAALTLALFAAVTVPWCGARLTRIYRDRPAAELTAPLDGTLAGGRGLVTNARTAEVMKDLQRAIALAGDRPVAVVADFPAHWVRAPAPNPLSIDWPQGIELNRPELRARVAADLEQLRGRGVIIVQRHHTATLAHGFVPTPDSREYALIGHVRERFRRTGGTAHFDLHE